jgi:hypothetical protein
MPQVQQRQWKEQDRPVPFFDLLKEVEEDGVSWELGGLPPHRR